MAQDILDGLIREFKHSLEIANRATTEVSGEIKSAIADIRQESKKAMNDIKRATIAQGNRALDQASQHNKESLKIQKENNKKSSASSNSSSTNEEEQHRQSNNHPFYNNALLLELTKKDAKRLYGTEDYKGMSVGQIRNQLLGMAKRSKIAKRNKDVEYGYGKDTDTQRLGDNNFTKSLERLEFELVKGYGEKKAAKLMAKHYIRTYDYDGNIKQVPDIAGMQLEKVKMDYEIRQQKEAEIKLEKEERQRKQDARDAERQQALALRDSTQLKAGIAGDLIQGGGGVAMGIALNKPTIVFASLATTVAKVSSRFDKLGKALAVVIGALSAIGAVANALAGRTNDNILKGAKSHTSPEYANALSAVGDKLLGNPDALMGSVNNITDLKATISNPVGFSQQLAKIASSGAGAIMAQRGINPLAVLNKINSSTTEEAMFYLGESLLPKFKNSNEALEIAKIFGVTDLLNANMQLKTTYNKKTGIMQEVEEVKKSAGVITAEAKAQQYLTGKSGAISSAKWGINNESGEKVGGLKEKFYNAMSRLSDAVTGGGNNARQEKAVKRMLSGKNVTLKDLQTSLNNSQFIPNGTKYDLNDIVNAEIDGTVDEYLKGIKFQEQARTLQNQIKNLPEWQQKQITEQFFNNNLVTAPIQAKATNSSAMQGIRYEQSGAGNPINVNVNVIDKTQNGIRAQHAGR